MAGGIMPLLLAVSAMNPPTTHLLYLHGFRSSPNSSKSVQVARRMQAQHPGVVWWCPQLPPSPRQALGDVMQGIAGWPREAMGVIGSSLGGFYATCVAEATGCRAVVLNPSVHPARDLAASIGEQASWHDPDDRFFFEPRFIEELRAMTPAALTRPERYFAVIAQGDEVLDWREMSTLYQNAQIKRLNGGDHALSDFQNHIDEVLGFLGL
jgi:predicted esterase YcpF (UPF0227 family)